MKVFAKNLSILLVVPVFFTTAYFNMAKAQNMESGSVGARIEKMERDMMLLQRQIARSGGSAGDSSAQPTVGGYAEIEVRLSNMEEQIRNLLGKIEENDFQIRKLSENLEKLQQDSEFRFGELENPKNGLSSQKSLDSSKNTTEDTGQERKPLPQNTDSLSVSGTETDESEENTDTEEVQTDFATPREHYNYAFRMLNQTKYDQAAEIFMDFIKKYPKDKLVGNAYYWRGETFYIRRDYINAADSFRQGFEEMPNGPKAPDNLLKLAMTLSALNRNKESCIVLGQVIAKFGSASQAVQQKAKQERQRIGCN